MKFTIKIMLGLPASGKTTKTNSILSKYNTNENYIKQTHDNYQKMYILKKRKIKDDFSDIYAFDLDIFLNKNTKEYPYTYKNFINRLKELKYFNKNFGYSQKENSNVLFVLDGMFIDKKILNEFLNFFNQEAALDLSNNINVEILYWKPEKEKLLHNNKGRKNNAEILIKSMKLRKPSLIQLKNKYKLLNIKIIEEQIIQKKEYSYIKNKLNIKNDFINNNENIEIY